MTDPARFDLNTWVDQPKWPYVVIHKDCGKPAFYLTKMPYRTEVMSSNIVRMLDGSEVNAGSEVRCGSCGEKFTPRISDIELTH